MQTVAQARATGRLNRTVQNPSEGSYFPKRRQADGRIAGRRGDDAVVICKDRGLLMQAASATPEPGEVTAAKALGRVGSDLG